MHLPKWLHRLIFSSILIVAAIVTVIVVRASLASSPLSLNTLATIAGTIFFGTFATVISVIQLFFETPIVRAKPPQAPFPPAPPGKAPQPTRIFSRRGALALLATFVVSTGATSIAWFAILRGYSRSSSTSSLSPTNPPGSSEQATAQANARVPGRRWYWQDSGNSIYYFEGVAWSGHQFVAVGQSGTILTSPDGRTWTSQNSNIFRDLEGVASSGSLFVAVGQFGTILTSPDGKIWATQNPGTSEALRGVIWTGHQFVIVGDRGSILTSP